MADLSITNRFSPSQAPINNGVNINFQDVAQYINDRNAGTATWDNVVVTNLVATNISASTSTGMKNRLINPLFAINQRQVTAPGDDTYVMDCWYVLTQSNPITVAQQALQEDGQTTNIRLTQSNASAQRLGLAQIIESTESQLLRGRSVVLSARIRSSSAQAIRFAILENTATPDTVTSDVVSSWTSTNYTASNFFIAGLTVTAVGSLTPAAATWTSISLTGTVSAAADNLIVLFWTEGTFAQNETLDIGVTQLEPGTVATVFDWRPLTQERPLCFRYYQKTYEEGTAPGTATNNGNLVIRRAIASETTTFYGAGFPVVMRVAPTVTWYNPSSGSSASIRNDSAGGNITVTGTDTQDPTTTKRVGSPTHAANGLAGNIILGHYTADASL